MKWRTAAILGVLLLVAGVSAGLVYAQLTDTQTASGTVNATSTSADLFICEPDSMAGPACGSDDSGADEIVFETLEDISPGDIVQWDLRLKNVGSADWFITEIIFAAVETLDPGGGCPDFSALNSFGAGQGVSILGKNGDEANDNPPASLSGVIPVPGETGATRHIKVTPGDYEDVRLRIQMVGTGTENCDGNEWNVSWTFTAG